MHTITPHLPTLVAGCCIYAVRKRTDKEREVEVANVTDDSEYGKLRGQHNKGGTPRSHAVTLDQTDKEMVQGDGDKENLACLRLRLRYPGLVDMEYQERSRSILVDVSIGVYQQL